ncbi:hypothetical protein ACJROX_26775 [Pseudalkalibacillus sp. A8]|uniref:hypothetical protein n=1 Tax=Pseudalkalibacillus sp. A8 TaxID=3382641 RepID=UPI0038B64E46
MKKTLIITLIIVSLCGALFVFETKANNAVSQQVPEFSTSSKYHHKTFGYFVLDLYHNEIITAVQEYYPNKNINGYSTPWWKKHDMVNIVQATNDNNIQGIRMIVFTFLTR